MASDAIHVQVSYALPGTQVVRDLSVAAGTTLRQAVQQSGILTDFPEIDLEKNRTGVFARLKPLDAVLRDRDRVEIYRPLIADPKEARRQRLNTSRGKP